MRWQWLITRWRSCVALRPLRNQDVRDRFDALDPLRDADAARMTHGPKIKAKPRSVQDWYRIHGRKAS